MKKLVIAAVLSILASQSLAGYTVAKIGADAPGKAFGLAVDDTGLYAGILGDVVKVDVASGNVTPLASNPSGNWISAVARSGGQTYTAWANQSGYGVPYNVVRVGDSTPLLTQNDVWDVAVSNGTAYVVTYPNYSTGTSIYGVNLTTGQSRLVANVGDYSGGVTFDHEGNLYYSYQGTVLSNPANPDSDPLPVSGAILKYSAAQLASGATLSLSDAQVAVSGAYAGYLTFDDAGSLYATTLYGYSLDKYNVATGQWVENVATGSIGAIAWHDGVLYTESTNWGGIGSHAFYAVTPADGATAPLVLTAAQTPEPATMAMLTIGGLVAAVRRRK